MTLTIYLAVLSKIRLLPMIDGEVTFHVNMADISHVMTDTIQVRSGIRDC